MGDINMETRKGIKHKKSSNLIFKQDNADIALEISLAWMMLGMCIERKDIRKICAILISFPSFFSKQTQQKIWRKKKEKLQQKV